MLIQQNALLEEGQEIVIKKEIAGRDVSLLGAFARGEKLTVTVCAPRALGASAVVLRIAPDGGQDQDLPLTFASTFDGKDLYRIELDTAALCPEEDGLFYYEFLFLRGLHTLFTDSINNVKFELSDAPATRFRLLIYREGFQTPAWFAGGVMYHIFADRFFRGEAAEGASAPVLEAGRVLNPDWENGIPQYPKKAGEPLSNNVFFGGNLWGVAQKLDYLQSLGVTVLYLSPIFKAASNHRYDIGDYERIDALLGGEEAFSHLLAQAHQRGMRVILDGVFNHTGDDSKYFNRRGHYDSLGAYQSTASPYHGWYHFRAFPEEYECWWGIEILPRLNHENEDCRAYFTSRDGVIAKWLRAGVDGWRLDVADELSDRFLEELRETVKHETNGEGLIIGEVWENAADKIAYGKRRKYLRGAQLDSVMNYPFRNAVLAFLTDGDAEIFCDILTELYASYPTDVCNSLMNLLGTHDTERILTLLGDREAAGELLENDALATKRLSPSDRASGLQLLKLASVLQYTVFGVPSVYYGDEAGLEGYHDPFCRMPFPWGREDKDLLAHYRALGRLRREHSAFADGSFAFLHCTPCAFVFERINRQEHLLVAANMGDSPYLPPIPEGEWKDAFSKEPVKTCSVPPRGFAIVYK